MNHQAYAVNENGKCFPLVYSIDENGQSSLVDPTNGCVDKCTSECKSIPQWEVNAIIDIRKAFDESMVALRKSLPTSHNEGCPNLHFSKPLELPCVNQIVRLC